MTLPPTTWSVTGKRGRRRTVAHDDRVTPRDEDRDVALFLLSLASSSAASDLRFDGISTAPSAVVAEQQRLRWRRKDKRKQKKEKGEVAETTKWLQRVYECEFCSERFPTAQALGGHRKNHLEKGVRSGRPIKRKMRKISSLAFDSGISFRFKPSTASSRSSLIPFASSSFEGKEAREEEDQSGGKHPSPSLFC